MRRIFLLTFRCIFVVNVCHVEGQNSVNISVIPPAPEVAAYDKYVNIPIGYYSGTPRIQIPLYTIHERGGIDWPIALSYHAAGFKVSEDAPRTGLGWTLTSVGVINRVVRGAADEYSNFGYLSFMEGKKDDDFFFNFSEDPATRHNKLQLYRNMVGGCVDTEPDIFYVALPDLVAKFYFDINGDIQVDCERHIKIKAIDLNPGKLKYIGSWEIVCDDGKKYFFTEQTTTNVIKDHPGVVCPLLLENNVVTSWHLSRVESLNSESWIEFRYSDYSQYQELLQTERLTNSAISGGFKSYDPGIIRMTYSGKQLSSIVMSSGAIKVNFVDGELREDIDISPPVKSPDCFSLGKIQVRNRANEIFKQFSFNYDYSSGRLTLRKIIESGGNEELPPFIFTYNRTPLPPVNSYKQDLWGFLNKNTKGTLIPALSYKVPEVDGFTVDVGGNVQEIFIDWEHTELTNNIPIVGWINLDGADRTPDSLGTLAGILKSITWPTGRRTTFDFEPHQYSYEQKNAIMERVRLADGHAQISCPLQQDIKPGKLVTREIDFTIDRNSDSIIEIRRFVTIQVGQDGLGFQRPTVEIFKNNKKVYGGIQSQAPGAHQIFENIILKHGRYKLRASVRIPPLSIGTIPNSVIMQVRWKRYFPGLYRANRMGGGVRIKKITESDGFNSKNDLVRTFEYKIEENNKTVSSGVASFYKFTHAHYFQNTSGPGPLSLKYDIRRYSINRTTLDPTQGSHVGYQLVSEYHGANGEGGKTVYKYTTAIQFPDIIISETVPFAPAISQEFKRGLLIEKSDYNYGGFFFDKKYYDLVAKQVNKYKEVIRPSIVGFKVGALFDLSQVTIPSNDLFKSIIVKKYQNVRSYSRISETSDSLHYPADNFVKYGSKIKYLYDEDQKLLKQSTIRNSSGKTITKQIKHPLDYRGSTDAAIKFMIEKNLENIPVEQIIYEERGNGIFKLISAEKNQFKIGPSDNIVVSKKLTTEPFSDIITSNPVNSAQALYEERALFQAYDDYGNILQQSKSHDFPVSYLWGYDSRYPIVEAINAKYEEVYFEGFEFLNASGISSNGEAKTGRRFFNSGTFRIPFTPPRNGKNFLMSYWYFEDEKWKLKSDVPFNRTIRQGTKLDDIRVYPEGAHMKTYTYDPDIGITSITDANNISIYFEYDGLARLITVKDHKKNILRFMQYKMQENISGKNLNFIRVIQTKKEGITSRSGILSRPKSEISYITKYIDGLGRSLQTIAKEGSPLGKDIVQLYSYDSLNREIFQWLPYVRNSSDGQFQDVELLNSKNELFSFYKTPPAGVAINEYPFTENQYDNSPINHLVKKGAAGKDWQLNSHPVKFKNLTNIATDEILNFSIENGKLLRKPPYVGGALQREDIIDEQGSKKYIFSDQQNRKIVERQQLAIDKWSDTYYIYDDAGNLVYVLPPNAIAKLGTSSELSESFLGLETFHYSYDSRRRIIEKQTPGAAPRYFIYDGRDRLVFSQDGNQRVNNEWSFHKYDELNREILSGVTTINRNARQMANTVDSFYKMGNQMYETITGQVYGYTNKSFPIITTGDKVLIINYYDDYNFVSQIKDSSNLYLFDTTDSVPDYFHRVKGMVTGKKIRVLGTNKYLDEVYYYDDHLRLIQSLTANHTGGVDRISKKYKSFFDQPYVTTLNHRYKDPLRILQRFDYDDDFRLISIYHKINDEDEVQLSAYQYNELGQLTETNLHKTKGEFRFLQSIDSRYNERGWLTALNGDETKDDDVIFNDFYRQEIFYNKSNIQLKNSPLFNGNISAIKWNTSTSENKVTAYSYEYDKFNRLTKALFKDIKNSSNNGHFNVGGKDGIKYDTNGNILGMECNGVDGNKPIVLDRLAYSYNGNMVIQVEDAGSVLGFNNRSSSKNEYTYDYNGNLTKDDNKGISLIKYNALNMPEQIEFVDGHKILFTYTAEGRKLTQVIKNSLNVQQQRNDYIGSFIYINDTLSQFPHEHGCIVYNGETKNPYEYQYYLKDQAGTVRIIFTSKHENTPTPVTEENQYYPFGQLISSKNGSRKKVKYLYHGKEQISEGLDWYCYEFRMYDPQLGRWNAVDPMADNTPGWSPYRAFFNNPVYWTDPTGMFEFSTYDEYRKFAGLKAVDRNKMGSQGHWLTEDREKHTAVWDEANSFNLQRTRGYQQYGSIAQRAAFYGWFQQKIQARGFETNWAGAAHIIAEQMSLVDDPIVSQFVDEAVVKFANAGNQAIFDDVFDNLRDLYNGHPLKGKAAQNWDQEILVHEQKDIVQPLYEIQLPGTIETLQAMAEGKGFKTGLGGIFDSRYPIGGPLQFSGNIMVWEDRYNHGMEKAVPFYNKYGSIFNWNRKGDGRLDTYKDPDNPGLLKYGEPKF